MIMTMCRGRFPGRRENSWGRILGIFHVTGFPVDSANVDQAIGVLPAPVAERDPLVRMVLQWNRRVIMEMLVLVASPQVKGQLLFYPASRAKLDRLIFPGIAEDPGKIGLVTVGNGDRESGDHVIHDVAAGLGEVTDQVGPVLAIDFNRDHSFIVGQFCLVYRKYLGLNDGFHLARRIRIVLLRKALSLVCRPDLLSGLPGQYSEYQGGGSQQDQCDPDQQGNQSSYAMSFL